MIKEVKFYWDNGNIIEHYFLNKKNKRHGHYRVFNNVGSLERTYIYKNGLWHNVNKLNLNSSSFRFISTDVEGIRHGINITMI